MIGRRRFIGNVFAALALLPAGFPRTVRADGPQDTHLLHDALNATIPQGATLRIVARSGIAAVPNGSYVWHGAPDGGACFAADDGGWVYVSNSELSRRRGGVGALRFNAHGELIDSYPILSGTTDNCAGGRTLWNTWLSCEESGDGGLVYECDPFGKKAAVARPALGAFNHEAAAFDPTTGIVYLTEDRPDGCLYRFQPTRTGDLNEGRLEIAITDGTRLTWTDVPDPTGAGTPLRRQIDVAARFKGGEGIIYANHHIYFTTKGDNRVWALHTTTQELRVIYNARTSATPILTGVDNLEVSPSGELLVAEDGGDMQIIALNHDYIPRALVTLHGQSRSEITGPSFSPDGTRLYFSSQRGIGGTSADGLTYELTLPA